jgi:hypothetical protein
MRTPLRDVYLGGGARRAGFKSGDDALMTTFHDIAKSIQRKFSWR